MDIGELTQLNSMTSIKNGDPIMDIIKCKFDQLDEATKIQFSPFNNNISLEEMKEYFKTKMKNELVVEFLENYPKDGKHLRLLTDIPCSITKGHDSFLYNDDKGILKKSKPQYWYVNFNNIINIEEHGKGFNNKENAYSYAKRTYIKGLRQELLKYNEDK